MTRPNHPLPRLARIAASATLLLATGCGLLGSHKEGKIPEYGVVDPTLPRELKMVSQPNHVIEPPDELEISVRPAAVEFSTTTAVVQADGNVDLAFLGDVYLAGLTLAEAEQKIAQVIAPLAAKRKVQEPVEVSIRNVTPRGDASKRYYVLGTVNTQGSFPLLGNETVVDAILAAGLKSNSLPEKAYLARPRPAGHPPQLFHIAWEAITMGDTLTNYQLFPGDRIIVPGGKAPSLLGSLVGGG